MHTFLEESDAASLRRSHRRRIPDIASRLSRASPRREEGDSPDVSSRPMVYRRSVSRARGSTASTTAACSSTGAGAIRSHHTEGDTIQAIMDLVLPQFGVGNRSAPVRKPWMVSSDSPASPDPTCTTDLARSLSPCLNLDTLSSNDAEESMIPRDISVTVLCSSEDDNTPIGSDQVLSDVDLPAASDSQNQRQVQQTQELSPMDWFFRWKVSMGRLENGPDGQQQHSTCVQDSTPAVRPRANKPGLSVADLSPVVGPVVMQGVSQAKTVHFSAPTMLGQPDPGSPQMIAFEELGDSSVPLSPNCVQAGRSQEMPADGSLFCVSPDTPVFMMRPAGATQQLPGAALPLPLAFDYVSDPFFGKPIAFAQCAEVPGSDGPMILAVYTMPTGASLMMG